MDGINRSRGWDKEIPHCVLPMEQLVLSDKWARNGYSRMETINPATEYCYHLGLRQKDSPLSLQWLYSFLERWPELRIRKPKKSGGGLNQMCNKTCH